MTNKACFKCGETKPLCEFYRHPAMGDGYLNKCAECTKKDVRKNRSVNLQRCREYDRNRPNKTERNATYYAWLRKRKADDDEYRLAANARHLAWSHRPENIRKKRANAFVNNALRAGRLTREPCEVCGSVEHIQAHHEDYDKPFAITWLCIKHHAARHVELHAIHRQATQ